MLVALTFGTSIPRAVTSDVNRIPLDAFLNASTDFVRAGWDIRLSNQVKSDEDLMAKSRPTQMGCACTYDWTIHDGP